MTLALNKLTNIRNLRLSLTSLIIFSPYFPRSVNLSAFLAFSLLKQAWSWLYFNCKALSSDLGSITSKSN